MMDRNMFERGLAGEPHLQVDFSAVQQRGSVLVRRRRTVAVSTVTGAAVVIVLGAALIPRMSGVDTASPAQIPGCAVVLGPTDTKAPPTGGPVDWISTSGETRVEVTGGIVEPSAAATDAPLVTNSESGTEPQAGVPSDAGTTSATTTAAATTAADRTAADSTPAEPTVYRTTLPPAAEAADGTGVFQDLAQPPDPLTAVFWKHLQDWGVSAHTTSQLGNLAFYAYPQADLALTQASISASGWAASDRGEGQVFVSVGPNELAGPPECHVGELDRRVTYADGTVVDLSDNNSMAYSNLSDVGVPVIQFHAVAYKPDGTQVIVFATNSVQLGDEDPETAGTRPTQGPPLTMEQVQQLAVDPTFSTGSAAFAQALAYAATLVPDVVGLSQQDAIDALQQAGFSVDPQVQAAEATPEPDAVEGAVIGQSPAGGDPVAPNSPVQLTTGTTTSPAPTASTGP